MIFYRCFFRMCIKRGIKVEFYKEGEIYDKSK